MRLVCLAGKDYFLDDAGRTLACVPHRKVPRLDPQLALARARLVFDRTVADPSPQFGGLPMARFIVQQHVQALYTGRNPHFRLSPNALKRLQAAVAAW